jgi:predicted AlkP superfamily pyrophosphatase or phosphodiesterase
MIRGISGLVFILSLGTIAFAQKTQERPKLVVGIIVDQMRQEYLYRFYDKFGTGGFKRLMGDGFMLKNAHYNYAPTVTGPGHASVYTGSTPAIHGIIGNDYFDKDKKKYVNCVADSLQKPVGSEVGKGDISPWRMLSSTVTDELELFTQKRSKVIGISSKDRGAVLPAGHMADAAYWYDGKNGNFISSTFYMTQLPEWLVQFNSQDLPQKYLTQDWTTLLPVEKYVESGPDETPYERQYASSIKSSFPYKFSLLKGKLSPEFLGNTPFADDLLTELAKAVIVNESMGKDDITDFLCISFSAPDAIGHRVGPNAVETQDTYLRLDKNIEDLLKNLDQQVGAGNYTLFLTADHAVADVPQYLKDNKVPAGYFNEQKLQDGLEKFLAQYYPGKRFIQNISNNQIFLNHNAFVPDPKTSGIELLIVTELIGKYLMTQEGVANYYTASTLRDGDYSEGGIKGAIIRGYNARRSGDIVYCLEPGWFDAESPQGTTHGTPYTYDTHVPGLFFGFGIKKGSSVRYHPITDIAPTISALLKIKYPSGCTGQPIAEIFE